MAESADEDNPYWHSEGQPHYVDLDMVRRLSFEIFNLFTANEALVREFEATGDEDENELHDPAESSLLQLHHEFVEQLIMEKLLQLCMLVRTYDDIMSQSQHADRYAAHANQTSGEDEIGTLNDGKLPLREACNKVIHAREIRPVYDYVTWEPKGEPAAAKRVWHL